VTEQAPLCIFKDVLSTPPKAEIHDIGQVVSILRSEKDAQKTRIKMREKTREKAT
jgi:hypothetical protein